jgi:eukaryotic translation initiation factor 2C
VGVKRPGYGTAGRAVTVYSNFFRISLPESVIHHYDGW